VRTYIGTCKLAPATGCTPAGTGSNLYRIIASVTWTDATCPQGCQYSASTLVDPSSDPVYNVRGASGPTAAADSLCFRVNRPAVFSIVSNDSGALGQTPVVLVSGPSHGTLDGRITSGVATYTPSPGYTGVDSFTYRLTDANGRSSSVVSVDILVTGGVCP
jgi:Bacterial Ig domain